MTKKFSKITQILSVITILMPAFISSGVVLADSEQAEWSHYAQRQPDGTVEMPISGATQLPNDDGTTTQGQSFNKAVYPNNTADVEGFDPLTGMGTYLKTLFPTIDQYNGASKGSVGAYLTPTEQYGKGNGIGGGGSDSVYSRYRFPLLELNYNQSEFSTNNPSITFTNKDSKPVSGLQRLNSAQISSFLNNVTNATVDYNKNGTLNLIYTYAVKVNANDIGALLSDIQKYGLGFNAFIRVPDGYTSKSIEDAIDSSKTNQLNIMPTQSNVKGQGTFDDSLPFVVNNNALNGYKKLQGIDDHYLKFSIGSGNDENYKSIMKDFLDKNKSGTITEWFRGLLFLYLIKNDLPIKLELNLNVDTMAKNGDAFDPSNDMLLTKGRKLPSVRTTAMDGVTKNDSKSQINVAFLDSTQTSISKVWDGGYLMFPNTYSDYGNLITNNGVITDRYMGKYAALDNHLSLITNISGKQSTVHTAGIYSSSSQEKRENGAAWSKDQWNDANVDDQGGNAFSTWNQYISLYDNDGTFNTKTEDKNPVYMEADKLGKTTKTLPGSYDLDRSITLNADDTTSLGAAGATFNAKDRFFRSVGYYDKQNTTAQTKANVATAYQIDGGSIVKADDVPVPDKGHKVTVWYYGTDERGNIFSPAKLTISRKTYNVPTVTGTSAIKTSEMSDYVTEIKDANPDSIINQKDTFTINNLDAGYKLSDQSVHVKLPDKINYIAGSLKVNGQTVADPSISGNEFDVKIPDGTTSPIEVTYDYKITEIGQYNVGKSTFSSTLVGQDADHGTENEAVNTENPTNLCTINVTETPNITLKKVPGDVNFGDKLNPLLEADYKEGYETQSDGDFVISSNFPYAGEWNLTGKLTKDGMMNGDVRLPIGLSFNYDLQSYSLTSGSQTVLSSANNDKILEQDNIFNKNNSWTLQVIPNAELNKQLKGRDISSTVTWTLDLGPTE